MEDMTPLVKGGQGRSAREVIDASLACVVALIIACGVVLLAVFDR